MPMERYDDTTSNQDGNDTTYLLMDSIRGDRREAKMIKLPMDHSEVSCNSGLGVDGDVCTLFCKSLDQ
jgi:hypothetical protein